MKQRSCHLHRRSRMNRRSVWDYRTISSHLVARQRRFTPRERRPTLCKAVPTQSDQRPHDTKAEAYSVRQQTHAAPGADHTSLTGPHLRRQASHGVRRDARALHDAIHVERGRRNQLSSPAHVRPGASHGHRAALDVRMRPLHADRGAPHEGCALPHSRIRARHADLLSPYARPTSEHAWRPQADAPPDPAHRETDSAPRATGRVPRHAATGTRCARRSLRPTGGRARMA
jgi:hypothetical protein